MKKANGNIWLISLLGMMLLIGIFLGYQLQLSTNKIGHAKSANTIVDEAIELVNAKYVDKINIDTLKATTIDALNKLDPNPVHITPLNVNAIPANLRNEFQGNNIEFVWFPKNLNLN